MSDGQAAPGTANSPPAAPGTAQNTQPGQSSQPSQGSDQYVTKAELNAVSQKISDLFGGLRNELKALKPASEGTADPKPSAAPPKPSSMTQEYEELKRMKDGLHASSKRSAIAASVAERLGGRTEAFTKYVLAVHGDRFKVADDLTVTVDDAGQSLAVNNWAEAFLATDEGKMFQPAPKVPSGDGLKPGATGAASSEFDGMTIEDLMADPVKYAKAKRENPALVDRLRVESDRKRQAKR